MRPRRKVTSVAESNAQQYGMTLWDDGFSRVAIDYPIIGIAQWLVDAMVARFVMRPDTLDVVVASDLSQDILSEFDSALVGRRGIAANANIYPLQRRSSMFEPVHGSIIDVSGKGTCRPHRRNLAGRPNT